MPRALLATPSARPDYDTWIAASEVLECAHPQGGEERAARSRKPVRWKPGPRRPIWVILNLNTAPFTPRANDLRNHSGLLREWQLDRKR